MRSLIVLAAATVLLPLSAPLGMAVAQTPTPLTPAGEGRRLYLKLNCYGCHGDSGTGTIGPDVQQSFDKGTILNGSENGMPAYARFLSATDLTNLQAYLRVMGNPGAPTFHDWWVKYPKK